MKQYTNLHDDLQIIEDFFISDNMSLTDLCKKLNISESDFLAIKNNIIEPSKTQLENIYNYAYSKGLFLNEIKWQESLDLYRHNSVKVCSHGARTYISGDIRLHANGDSNDFEDGFYIGQDISQAGMFVADDPESSLYILTFNPKGLRCAYFDISEDWMLAIGLFRHKLTDYENHPRLQAIRDKVDASDFVYAPIADNKIFECIDSFIDGEITNLQCLYALSATHLGYQYVLKTQRALDNLEIKDHLYYCAYEKSLYTKQSDVETNTSNNKAIIAKKRYKGQGEYISEILL